MPVFRERSIAPHFSGGGACLVLIAAAFGLAQCDRDRGADLRPVDAVETPDTPTEPAPSALPALAPALDRAGLIGAAARAASAYASGQAADGVDPLVGRAFSVTTPFACGRIQDDATLGDAPAGLARAGWGPDRKTIRLTLEPGDWTGSALMAQPGAEGEWEAVEGFWLARPWLASSACPAVARDPLSSGAGDAAVQTVGMAAVFDKGASRVTRRNGRAYSFTVRSQGEETAPVPPAAGYRVLIEGRIGAFPGGRAFRCQASSPELRPVCIAAISLDRVAFTLADGTVLSEWRPD